jgi:hypothetical protein
MPHCCGLELKGWVQRTVSPIKELTEIIERIVTAVDEPC